MRGFDTGGDVQDVNVGGNNLQIPGTQANDNSELTMAIIRLNNNLERGIIAVIDRDGQFELREALNEYNEIEENATL